MKTLKSKLFEGTTLFALLSCLALLFASCGGGKNENGWYTDFDKAKKAALSKDKDIVLFVSSMYDIPGTQEGVDLLVGTSEFTKAVAEDFVCVYFDFTKIPEIMGQNPDSLTGSEQKSLEKKQDALRKQLSYADIYGVRSTPELSLITREGFFISSVNFDYLDTSVSGYKDMLYMEIGPLQDFEELLDSARSKKGTISERMDLYDSILKSADEVRRRSFYPLWKEAAELDRKNESGMLGEFIIETAHIDATNEIIDNRNLEAASKIYENAASDERISADEKQLLLYYATEPYRSSSTAKFDEIIRLLNESLEASPESQYADGIRMRIEEAEADKAEYDSLVSSSTGDEK